LGFAIGLVSRVALWATPPGVARIDGNDRDTREPRLVGDKLAKLTERPPMQTAALRSCGLNRLRMCVRSSIAIALRERLALATISFEMQWLVCFLNLASLPDNFLSLRLAALVPQR